ncbi:hypothetical protein [Aliarcobacter butzleri]|uniref:hypothetical protein n=1 Tax=Aliarcobacter TaxID=2321111 RepID=UPI002B2501C4|nr:hypothetical protein [Aliarcobacter butzleri]
MLTDLEIEKLESKYLNKFYHFLKYVEDEMMYGFQTKELIRNDWEKRYGNGQAISDFAVGAERIIYSLFNGKGIGQPNSAPVGADMFFEVEDAFIHIDLKTVQTDNIGDYTTSIFVGENQNSYVSEIKTSNGKSFEPPRFYNPALPQYYNSGSISEKVCLTFFITILYEAGNLNILNINLLSMPNGQLEHIYGSDILRAGKNPGKIRYNFSSIPNFKLLDNQKRIKVVYFNESMSETYLRRLNFIETIKNSQ